MDKGINPRTRRVLFFIAVSLTSLPATGLLFASLIPGGITALEWVQLLICIVFFWEISFYFWTFVFGFFLLLLRRTGSSSSTSPRSSSPWGGEVTTALVMPIYNEEPRRVYAGLQAILDSLAAVNLQNQFHLYVLSDSNNPDIRQEEEFRFEELRRLAQGSMPVFYRNRMQNTGKKMGNIRDFCNTHGHRYRYMVILDADSIMSGETLAEMVRRMERHPRVGLIQVPAYPVNKSSLFARMQQFSCAAYGPMVMSGLSFWQLGESNYWGHNAIIRIEPFVRYCELPPLPGREPFGGEIWSHDFLEAAFLRRAGWEVWLAPDLAGSYEEVPPTLVDYAKRDRRWCQGNLQHLRFLFARGLHHMSRIHLLMGILSYLTSPLWLILVAVTGVIALTHPEGPGSTGALGRFAEWPLLLAIVLMLLFFPRILALFLILRDRRRRTSFGGGRKVILSLLLETLFSLLLAPIHMMFKTQFVIATLLRRRIHWAGQRRDGQETGYKEAFSVHGWQTLLGLAAGVVTYFQPEMFLWWFTPALFWLIFSIPLSILLSLISPGEKLKRIGLFLIPEEASPPPILKYLKYHLKRNSGGPSRYPMFLGPGKLRRYLGKSGPSLSAGGNLSNLV